jgi:FkbM family methyltransferase
MYWCALFVIGKALSRVLIAYYRGPDHPMKLRLWRYLRQLLAYRPLTVSYGNGTWISVDERDWLQSAILSRGLYEGEVWEAMAGYADTDEVVWDVGAHIGSFVLKATQDHRVKAVCAFEPDPVTLNALRQNLALNGNPATVYPVALSDAPQRRRLIHGPATNTGMSTLAPTHSTGMTDHMERLSTFEVACRTADELIQTGDAPAPTLMKIDVEGWEYRVLQGCKRLLQSSRLKAIAFEAGCDRSYALEDHRLEEFLTHNGYSISHIQRPTGERRGVENYLAVHA